MGQRKGRKAKRKMCERTKSCESVFVEADVALESPCRLLRGGGDEGKDGRKDGREVLWLAGGRQEQGKKSVRVRSTLRGWIVWRLSERNAKGFSKRKKTKEK